jgi:hypothetical protein
MHALEGPFKVFLEVGKRAFEGRRPRNQHIIMILSRLAGRQERDESAQAAADAISDDGPAHGLGDGESEARAIGRLAFCGARLGLEHEGCRRAARAAPDPQEFRPFLESDQSHGRGLAKGAI